MTRRGEGGGDQQGKGSGSGSGVRGRIVVVRAPYYADVVAMLRRGVARAVSAYASLSLGGAEEDVLVGGALELPLAMSFFLEGMGEEARAAMAKGELGVVALGCVVRGETEHFSLVSEQCYRGLQEVSLRCSVPLGMGVLACNSLEQARARADTKGEIDCGGQALRACCGLMSLKQGCRGG